MTGPAFTTALTTLCLDNHQAAAWLGVSVRAVQRYRVTGAPGPVERAVEMAIGVRMLSEIAQNSGMHGKHARDWNHVVYGLALDWRE